MGTQVKVETAGARKLFLGKACGSRWDGQGNRTPGKAAKECEVRRGGRSWGSNAMERLSRTMTKKLLALVILNEPVRGLGNGL